MAPSVCKDRTLYINQIKMKSTKIAALVLAGTAATGMVFASSVAAQESSTNDSTFIQRLAEKLGIAESDVETAVTDIRSENQVEREAEMQAKIDAAVADGTITSRQAEILEAMKTVRENLDIEKPDRSEFENLTQEERQALMEEHKAERDAEVLAALNEAGLDVTQDELDELHTVMKEAGLGGPRGGQGPRGGGFGGRR